MTETYAERLLQRVQEYASDCFHSAETDDARVKFDNLSCLYAFLTDAVAAQSREFRQYVRAARDAETERDEALALVDQLRDEVADLREQLSGLAARS